MGFFSGASGQNHGNPGGRSARYCRRISGVLPFCGPEAFPGANPAMAGGDRRKYHGAESFSSPGSAGSGRRKCSGSRHQKSFHGLSPIGRHQPLEGGYPKLSDAGQRCRRFYAGAGGSHHRRGRRRFAAPSCGTGRQYPPMRRRRMAHSSGTTGSATGAGFSGFWAQARLSADVQCGTIL